MDDTDADDNDDDDDHNANDDDQEQEKQEEQQRREVLGRLGLHFALQQHCDHHVKCKYDDYDDNANDDDDLDKEGQGDLCPGGRTTNVQHSLSPEDQHHDYHDNYPHMITLIIFMIIWENQNDQHVLSPEDQHHQ